MEAVSYRSTPPLSKIYVLIPLFAIPLLLYPMKSYAPLCTNQLQEDANVFEVNCALSLETCSVQGYFRDPRFSPGYTGLVAWFQPMPEAMSAPAASGEQYSHQLLIMTYRHQSPEIATPDGYFSAMKAAEQIMLRERENGLIYFDALTGERVPPPKIECVPIDQ